MEFKAGQTCWHIKDAGLEIEENGETYVLIDDYDILGYTEN
jgi:co-chaperonin GroES (HSP10)